MAEDNVGQGNGKQPPKIKLNGNGNAAPPPKNGEQEAKPKTPPKVEGKPGQFKERTARIDLANGRKPSAQPPQPASEKEKTGTAKIGDAEGVKEIPEEEAEDLSKGATIRIDSPLEAADEMEQMSEEDRDEVAKKATVRIDTSTDMTPVPEEDTHEATKKSTVQIDTPATPMEPISEDEKDEVAKKSTVRVQIEEDRAKGDTAKLEPVQEEPPAEVSKKRTARINLNEVLDEEDEQDIFKRRTALIDSSKFEGETQAPGVPRTIRIKRPPGKPPTTQIKQKPPQQTAEEQTEENVATPISQVESGRKSETARIDLPPEAVKQPPTRRKTIRIKRPGGTTSSKPLVISRTTTSVMLDEKPKPSAEGEEEPSALFSWLAIAAVLIAVVLVYVLGSQTGTLESLSQVRWPYPGAL